MATSENNSKILTYKDAGVNIESGNKLVSIIRNIVSKTKRSGSKGTIGNFGGLFDLEKAGYKNPILVSATDGVGTKILIAEEMNSYDSIGIDLVAMSVNDVVVQGAEPLFFLDYFVTPKLDVDIATRVINGIARGCELAGAALIGGETAEMPNTYLPDEHDLVGVITGVVDKDKIITGETIRPGDAVLGLPSSGLHTNGYSFARKLFFDIGGYDINDSIPKLQKSIGLTLLEPHINYTKHVFAALDTGVDIKGIAHITGGGLLENIPRILPNGCGVELQKGSWPNIPVFGVMQSIGNVNEDEMFRAFNMGIGMVFVVETDDADSVKDALKNLTEVYEIGSIIKGNGVKIF